MNERTMRALKDLRMDLTHVNYPSAATRIWEWIWALDDVIGDQPERRMPRDFNGGFTTYEDSPFGRDRT